MPQGFEVIFQVQEEPDGGFWAQALGHDIFTQADDLEGLKAHAVAAIRAHFTPEERPATVRLHLVKDVLLAV
jgi:hypothetical protein